MTIILDGKLVSDSILKELSVEIAKLDKKPHLAVILVGEDSASQVYVKNKKIKAESIGIKSTVIKLSAEIPEDEIIKRIGELNKDDLIDGVLVQLPLPKHINEHRVIEAISSEKDVDGLTEVNMGKLINNSAVVYPCTPKGIMTILNYYNIPISGKHVVIVGRSKLVGKPLAIMMLQKDATVTICHSKTENLENITKTADILISAVGHKIIKADMVKSGAIVVDVGIFRDENGKLTGDVYFNEVKEKTSFITPVPGGVGLMTTTTLMQNTFDLFKI